MKRRRVDDADAREQRAAEAAEWDTLVPSDTLLALRTVRSRFSCVVPSRTAVETICPVATAPLSTLRGTMGPQSSVALEQELDVLAGGGIVRLYSFEDNNDGVIFTEDMHAYIEHLRAAAAATPPGGAPVEAAMSLYCALCASTRASSITGEALASAFAAWAARGRPVVTLADAAGGGGAGGSSGGAGGGDGSARRGGGAGGRRGSSAAASESPLPPLAELLRVLQQRGLLVPRRDTARSAPSSATATAAAYRFGVPEAGRLLTHLTEGRKELISKLRRTPARRVSRSDALAMTLTRSLLSTDFHIRDALGRGILREAKSVGQSDVVLVGS